MDEPLHCHACKALLPSKLSFCTQCGSEQLGRGAAHPASLSMNCVVCQAEVAAVSRYCTGCGSPMNLNMGEQAHIEERRVVTLLQADVVGFTRLSEQRSPEEVKNLMDAIFGVVSREIVLQGGVIDKFIGDAVVALFGVPVSHGDDARRAVEAAIAMHRAVEALSSRLSGLTELTMRIGIDTGSVVVGRVAGSHRPTVTGPSVHSVMELEAAAPPGRILIGEGTYRSVQPLFAFKEFTRASLNREAYLLATRQGKLGSHVSMSVEAPLVGREAEVEQLLSCYRQTVQDNKISLLRLHGPTGIGKSRVRRAFVEKISTQPKDVPLIAMGSCSPTDSGALLGQWLRNLMGAEQLDRRVIHLFVERSRGALPAQPRQLTLAEQMDLSQGDIVDLLCHLLGVDVVNSSILQGVQSEPSLLRLHVAAAVGLIFYCLAQSGPLLLVAENDQWCRMSVRDLVEQCILAAGDIPLLLLQVRRVEGGTSQPVESANLSLTIVTVPPLSDGDVRQLVHHVTGKSPDSLPRMALLTAGLGEGNPLLLLELLRHLKDPEILNSLQSDGDSSKAGGDALLQLVQARLDRLPDEARRLIRAASVVGVTFWDEALERMGSPNPEQMLQLLETKGLIRPTGRSSIVGVQSYEFISPLIRDVAYANILVKVRGFLHKVAAAWLEERLGDRRDTFGESLARHHIEGGNLLDGARYLLRAGTRARAIYANDEALSLLLQVRDVLHGIDKPDACRMRAEVQALLGGLAQEQGVVSKAAPHFQAGLQLLEGLNSPEDDLLRARLNLSLGEVDAKHGHLERGMVHFDRAMKNLADLENSSQVSTLRASIHRTRGSALARVGNFAEAHEQYEKGISHVDEKNPLERAGAAMLHSSLGVMLRNQGQPVAALGRHRTALSLARSTRDKRLRCLCLVNWALVLTDLNELKQARLYFEEALLVQGTIGLREDAAISHLNLAHLFLLQSQFENAQTHLAQCQPILERYTTHWALPEYHRTVAELGIATGDLAQAPLAALRAVELSRTLGNPTALGEALRTLSQTQVACGEQSEGLRTIAEGRICLEETGVPRELAEIIITQVDFQRQFGTWRPGRMRAELSQARKLLKPYPSDALRARLETLQEEVARL